MPGVIDETLYADLVGMLYSSVVDETRLKTFTNRLSSLTPVPLAVALRRIDTIRGMEEPAIAAGFDEGFLQTFVDYYSERNPYLEKLVDLQLNKPAFALDHVDRRAIEHTEFYSDWLRPQGFRVGGLAMNVARGSRYILNMSVDFPDDLEERLGAELASLFRRLLPHLQSISEMNGKAWFRGVKRTVDALVGGALVLSPIGKVLHMNAAAERVMALSSLSVDAKGMLRGRTMQVEGAVEHALDAVMRGEAPARSAWLREPTAFSTLTITVARLPTPTVGEPIWSLSPHEEAAAIVYLAAEFDRSEAVVPRLMTTYGLSEHEAMAAFLFYSGLGHRQIAMIIGVNPVQASITVDKMMTKLDARRYADVVRRVSRFTPSV